MYLTSQHVSNHNKLTLVDSSNLNISLTLEGDESAYLRVSPVLLDTGITDESISSTPLDSVSSDLLSDDGRVPPDCQLIWNVTIRAAYLACAA